MLWTTLRVLRAHDACAPRYKHLRKQLGKGFGDNTPIPLLHILCLNGLDDTLWTLRATHSECKAERDRISRLMAADFAETVLPIYEVHHPDDPTIRGTLATVRRFARGQATKEELDAARGEAWTVWTVWTDRTDWTDWTDRSAARSAAWATAGDAVEAARKAAEAAWVAAKTPTPHSHYGIVFDYLAGRRS